MQDQSKLWDEAHSNRQLHAYSKTQTSFALEVDEAITEKGALLELGCGEGNDSIYLAAQGFTVLATDFSPTAVTRNSKALMHPNLRFEVLDISQPFDFPDNSFDVIYARLSLHYFTDDATKRIFSELARVLKPGGYLCFMCKSVDDGLYGQGEKIEADMFEQNGHVRHFFSEDYTRLLLRDNGFTVTSLEKSEEKLYDRQSAFIKVIATKR